MNGFGAGEESRTKRCNQGRVHPDSCKVYLNVTTTIKGLLLYVSLFSKSFFQPQCFACVKSSAAIFGLLENPKRNLKEMHRINVNLYNRDLQSWSKVVGAMLTEYEITRYCFTSRL